jgi:glycosyltransferase involved in cell wall biosynthesis
MPQYARHSVAPNAAPGGHAGQEAAAPAVSVILPTYNRAATLRRAAQSVLNQTYRDLELIVVDDGSKDGSAEVIAALADHRVRFVQHPENQGGSAARNTGLRLARGRYVAFQDSDDVWVDEKLARQVAHMEENPDLGLVYCGMTSVADRQGCAHGSKVVRYTPGPEIGAVAGNILGELAARSFISTQTILVRRDVLSAAGGFDAELPALQDWDLTLRLAGICKVGCVPDSLVFAYFSGDSVSLNQAKRSRALARILAKYPEIFEARPRVCGRYHYTLARGFMKAGAWPAARTHIRLARKLNPTNAKAWLVAAAIRAVAARHALAGGRRALPVRGDETASGQA